MRIHRGTLFAGVVYLGIGVAFILEALEVWALQIGDLRFVGPIALVVLGLAVVIGSMRGAQRSS
ncbi:MAG TPA: hypothetical protein VLA91_09835 [Acidimicrobiia bacterium]|jgi:hypothetical protein|nr:hypothetical protein [Acidimicrobiia bacterium]